ncbi:NAD(P)/FAD-dependent oxidoreductase [Roseibium suaedae]|uniref:Glycine/D-amino acid oxidase n=1 Tax=Roseibium suaedae TaxID=735517 RepID=A0A1M7NQR1_9HYPH|nr:FAD-binding oxidoreductase [Roseibium suaedae]SHN05745.1 Glycine/D-amino acid oxidase [Roseibium suaedae]
MNKHVARRLPVHQGPAGWSAILPNSRVPLPIDRDTNVDIAIVGGGFAGLTAAHWLHRHDPSIKIAVLEAGRVGEGSAGRNSGFMIDLPHELTSEDYAGDEAQRDRVLTTLNRQAIEFAGSIVSGYGMSPHFFDRCGKINGAVSENAHKSNLSYGEHLAHLGEHSELLDAKAMHELTGSRHYFSGLYTPGTVLIQPAGYVRGFAAGLERDGVRIAEESPVRSLEKESGSWRLETPGGTVRAGKVILATNGHLESFGFKRGRLMHIFLFAAMSAEMDADALARLGGKPRWGITPADPMGTTMRRIDSGQGGNRMVTRSFAVYRPDMEPLESQFNRARRVMRQKFDERYPQLTGFPMQYEWSGHLCLSSNGVSVVQELEPGLFSACVQNGLGTTRGTLAGIAAAEMAMDKTSEVTAFFAAEAEPRRLPPEPFGSLGANAYLCWREHKASRE